MTITPNLTHGLFVLLVWLCSAWLFRGFFFVVFVFPQARPLFFLKILFAIGLHAYLCVCVLVCVGFCFFCRV